MILFPPPAPPSRKERLRRTQEHFSCACGLVDGCGGKDGYGRLVDGANAKTRRPRTRPQPPPAAHRVHRRQQQRQKKARTPLRGCYLILGFVGHPSSHCRATNAERFSYLANALALCIHHPRAGPLVLRASHLRGGLEPMPGAGWGGWLRVAAPPFSLWR